MMRDLKEKAVRGGLAKIWGQGAFFLLRVGSLMILARILEPKDFGLVGMVTAVTGVFSLFKDAGLSMATVQRPTITEEQVSTLFWVNISVGVILGLLTLAAAPVIAAFYHEPRLFWVAAALAAGFLFNAAGVQHTAILQRRMRFAVLAVIETLSLLISTAVGIGMAIGGFGYWALVAMSVTSPAALTLLAWLTAAWVPGRPQRRIGVRSMLRFGGTVTLNGLVMYIAYSLDKVLIGRFWGAEALGIYGRAYQIIDIPRENLSSAVGTVAISALSRLQDDPHRFRSYFLKGYSMIQALTLPITAACALFADEIILVVLGPAWKDAAIVLRLLTPTILIIGLINPLGWMLCSLGLVRRSLRIALVMAPLIIAAYFLGLPYGPRGVAFALSAVMTLWVVPHIVWCIHGTMIHLRDIFHAVGRPFLSASAATLVAFGIRWLCSHFPHVLGRLVLGISILFGIYIWMLLFVMGQKAFYLPLIKGLRKRSLVDEKER